MDKVKNKKVVKKQAETKVTQEVKETKEVKITETTSANKLVIKKPEFSMDSMKNFAKANPKVISILTIVAYALIAVFSFAGVDLLVQYLNNDYSIAVVNGDRVPKSEYMKRLEQINGQKVVTQLIDETLFRAEAESKGVTATKEEIDDLVNQYIEYVGGEEKLNQALKDSKSTMEDFRYSLESDILAKKVVTADITVTDDELVAFFEQYADQMYPNEVKKDESGKVTSPIFSEKKEEVKEIYLNQQFVQLKTTWLADRKSQVVIQDNFTTKPEYGFFKATISLFENFRTAVN